MDPLQNIFLGTNDEMITLLQRYGFARFDLNINCRNTKSVAVTTSIISGIDLPLEGAIDGGKSEVRYFGSQALLIEDLEKFLEKLLAQKIPRSDIVILSCYKLENSSLAGISKLAGMKVLDLTEAVGHYRGIDFCTFHAFKGLERKIVIAIDLNNMENDAAKLLHYCGLSRARTVLTVFLSENDRATYEQLAYKFGKRLAGQTR